MNYSNFTDKDIINGRGQGIQRLPGNVMFRNLVNAHKQTYAQAPMAEKQNISKGIVIALRHFGFKFLKLNTKTHRYDDIGDTKAVEKTSQALREGQPDIRRELAAEMNDSNSSTNTSSKESCINFSKYLLQSLSEEDAPDSQQETQETLDIPRPLLLHNQRSISDRIVHLILKEVGVKEAGLSERELSAQLREISNFVVSEVIRREDERLEFEFSFTDRFSSMSLDDNGNVEAV
jgi:hypothetical protein